MLNSKTFVANFMPIRTIVIYRGGGSMFLYHSIPPGAFNDLRSRCVENLYFYTNNKHHYYHHDNYTIMSFEVTC
ncbi:hypothetical protein DERF_003881 [Dermatophagoides farinae]|uniref:Uncharacterized protein n=1 Tax=Dermatophagoides farinae TaxID=6954 RepID=A0A922IFR6_DERFA|nr:hypothetical protein DERF_003881 [Dermatophagoides farinae]